MNTIQPDPATATQPIQAMVFRLVCGCPATEQSNCVLKEVRLLSVRDRYEWVKTLSGEQLEEVYQAHGQCLRKQMRSSPLRLIHSLAIN